MKRSYFIALFVLVHTLFIAIQIDKQSRLVQLSYEKQRHEKEKNTLSSKKQELTNSLYALKNPSQVKQYATTELTMKPLELKKVKRITHS